MGTKLGIFSIGLAIASCLSLVPLTRATAQNQVLGQVDFAPKAKIDKTGGVWVDGQYVGFVEELKGDKKVLLLPGQHEISVRQTGYIDSTQKIITEPGKITVIDVALQKDPQAQYAKVTSEIKLKVNPDRAAVFVDGNYVGTVREFDGVGKAMLVDPGKHHVKIALPGYQSFDSDVSLIPHQKVTVKTDLAPGSIQQSDPSIKQN